ncbi:acyl-CoA thioesterase [Salarchaeum japonicum]|uniref:Acyl-CoA thioesterase n=1 Tax=Salarchaeum japonicum TaxID=555573 RepID=A0AAV3SZB5_9EURY|nr:acyl-CoA thioesterase [Salarchaeum japonicum]
MDSVPLFDSYTERSEILMPNQTNNLGRALGGAVLHWMDICGAITGRRFARRQVVTASMDHVDFLAPIDLGDIVTVRGYVFDTGASSLDVKVDVSAERPSEREKRDTTSSFFTFVALDDDENPASVPDVATPTDEEAELRADALRERRERREAIQSQSN